MASAKHKTNVSGQASFAKHTLTTPQGDRPTAASSRVWLDYEVVCHYFPDEAKRANALGVTAANITAWRAGRGGRSLRRWRRPFARIRRICEILEPHFESPESIGAALLAARPDFDGRSSLRVIIDGDAAPEVVAQLLTTGSSAVTIFHGPKLGSFQTRLMSSSG